jgi:carboxymethylenebutenolidase
MTESTRKTSAAAAELRSLRPLSGLDRRGFLTTSLGVGFAAAAGPVGAQAITTDTEGLEAGEVRIPVDGGELPAYRARPKRLLRDAPVILVVQEIFGVHEHIKDVCRRFAKLGYLAIAPELFARQGNPATITDIQVLMRDIVAKVPDAQVMSDLDATVRWAARNGGQAKRIAVTGFCWGGRITWLYAAHNPRVKAGIAWYGRVVGEPNPLQPRHPVDVVGELKAPVLGLYAGKDGGIPLESVERMRKALQGGSSAARASDIIVYPLAQHGFYADYRPSYNKADATAAFSAAQRWLVQHGMAAKAVRD